MRTVYRVTVAAVNYDDEGNFVSDETLFEATHHRPEALLRFAPNEVDDALRTVAGVEPIAAGHILAGLPTIPDPASADDTSIRVCDGGAVAQQSEAPVADAAPKTTRRRRTKAEIEADKAAEAAKSTAQAVQGTPLAPLAAAVAEEMTEPEPTAAPAAAPVTAPEPVPAEAPPAVPWNPFEQR